MYVENSTKGGGIMRKYKEVLKKCALFINISDEDLISLLNCLNAKVLKFTKNETIFFEGASLDDIGIVLSGSVQILRNDYDGNRSIINSIGPSQLFGESFAFAKTPAIPISVIAAEDTEILIINADRITKTCCNSCEFHNTIVINLLRSMALKNIFFYQKSEITSKRTTKEKLMAYLIQQSKINNSKSFTIPFNRQELADFLEVDRSGLSAQISKLKSDGVIECHKNNFKIS